MKHLKRFNEEVEFYLGFEKDEDYSNNPEITISFKIPESMVKIAKENGVSEENMEDLFTTYISHKIGETYNQEGDEFSVWCEESDNIVDFIDYDDGRGDVTFEGKTDKAYKSKDSDVKKEIFREYKLFKKYKLFESVNETEIHEICKKYNIKNYTINEDGSIDGHVLDLDGKKLELDGKKLIKLPLRFRNVSGYFYCHNNNLTSLEGGPKSVGGGFYCSNNNLTTLEGTPESVGGGFYCSNNNLTSLEGAPESVGGDFDCHNNNLTTLEGAPESVGGDFYCSNNNLTTLEGAPESVGGVFYCSNNNLTTLEGAPESVGGYFDCSNNNLTTLEGTPESVGGGFYCNDNNLTSLEGAPESVGGYFDCSNNNLTTLEGTPESVGGGFYCNDNNLTSLEGAPESVGGYFYCSNNNLTSLDGLEFKSFKKINLENNPVYEIVKYWINSGDSDELIEYFIDLNIIQGGEEKPKLILPRLESFHEDLSLEMNINFDEVKKYYEIIK